ncbi:MAG: DUF6065 family protein [Proteobacteria bacterium]|nr:DUF6065 family protein [Pseudomonadota bacterium]
MKLIAYPMTEVKPELRPAPSGRAWMDALPEAYAYRCLPLIIANAHGWEICCPAGFEATWNGGAGKDAIVINADPDARLLPTTHFGSGILTFHAGYLFRTEPGISLLVQGPVNRPKDAISALSGVVETDWSPYTFTMNWQFTRPGQLVRFDAGEPFCHFFPVGRTDLEAVEPEIRDIAEDPDTLALHKSWSASRNSFNSDLLKPGSPARDKKWQKDYYRGFKPDGTEAPADHRAKLRLAPFRDLRQDAQASTKDDGNIGEE